MRKTLAAALTAAIAAFVAACGPISGDPSKAGPSPSPSSIFQPAANTCHAKYVSTGYANTYKPVDCSQTHQAETVFVGTLSAAQNRPVGGTPEALAAFKTIPGEADRAAGAHWYRCELMQIDLLPRHWTVSRTGSLRGELAKHGTALAFGCFTYDPDLSNLNPAACSLKHNSEYVGTISINTWDAATDNDGLAKRCLVRVAAYAGVAYRSDFEYRTGVWWDTPQESEFAGSDREVRCFAWGDGAGWSRSLKSAGLKALPLT